jgi:two-component system chemotaxis sensor kinase CheA
MSIDFAALTRTFLAESREGLETAEENLLALERGPFDGERIDEVFRRIHTLKGDAGSLGFERLGAEAHRVEDVLEGLRASRAEPSRAQISELLADLDLLRQRLERAAAGRDADDGDEPKADAAAASRETLRVPVARLDALLELVAELRTARNRATQALTDRSVSRPALVELHAENERLYSNLEELVTALRMVPLGPLFRRAVRTARDLAVEQEKDVLVEIAGEDVEIDTRIGEALGGILGHAVRNAIDHGLEMPEVRTGLGKATRGTLRLSARHQHRSVVIEIADDGGGIDRRRVLAKARDLGLVGADELPTDAALDRLVLTPGFSTTEAVSAVSGRGVGLDAVRRRVEEVRGSVEIESRPGQGTTLRLRLPSTLLLIEGFRVGVGGEVYVVPLEHLVETAEMPAATGRDRPTGLIQLRGETLPFWRLREAFQVRQAPPAREFVLVVEGEGERFGLVVDELYGQEQTVVKRLSGLFDGVSAFAGSTLLGDGRVALILDVAGLHRSQGRAPDGAAAGARIAGASPAPERT